MASHQTDPNQNVSDQHTDDFVTRRDLAKKAAYVVPRVLAVIAVAERSKLAASGIPPS
jgi:hypothetical protein